MGDGLDYFSIQHFEDFITFIANRDLEIKEKILMLSFGQEIENAHGIFIFGKSLSNQWYLIVENTVLDKQTHLGTYSEFYCLTSANML